MRVLLALAAAVLLWAAPARAEPCLFPFPAGCGGSGGGGGGGGFSSNTPVTALNSTTPRSVGARAADVYNVLDWGADPTGGGDLGAVLNTISGRIALSARPANEIVIPAGSYTLSTQVVFNGVAPVIRGAGFTAGPGPSGASGTWITITGSAGFNAFLIEGGNARGVVVKDIAITEAQPAVTDGWSPTAYDYVFRVQSTLGEVTFDNVLMSGVTNGIYVDNSGRLDIKNVFGQFFVNALTIDDSFDIARIERLHSWPYWSNVPAVAAYQQAHLRALTLKRVDGVFINDLFNFNGFATLYITNGTAGSSTKLYADSIYSDQSQYGVLIDAHGSNGQISKITTQHNDIVVGSGAIIVNSRGMLITGDTNQYQVGQWRTNSVHGNAIDLEGFNNRVTFDDFWSNTFWVSAPGDGTPAINVSDTTGSGNPANFAEVRGTPFLQGVSPLFLFNPTTNGGRSRTVQVNSVDGGSPGNEVRVYDNTAGNPVSIAAIGSDTKVDLQLQAKSSLGSVRLQANGQTVLRVDNANGSTDDMLFRGGASVMNLIAEGPDTNIDEYLTAKGPTGGVRFQANGLTTMRTDNPNTGNTDLLIRPGTGVINLLPEGPATADIYVAGRGTTGGVRLQANGTTTLRVDNPSATANDVLVEAGSGTLAMKVEGSTPNINLVLVPKGSGSVVVPTMPGGDNSTNAATTAWVKAQGYVTSTSSGVSSVDGAAGAVVLSGTDLGIMGGAPLDSPAFINTPTAPTQTLGDTSTDLATDAFVAAAIAAATFGGGGGGVTTFNTRAGAVVLGFGDISGAGGALLSSPVFVGAPRGPTPALGDSSTRLATTAGVNALLSGVTSISTAGGTTTLSASQYGNGVLILPASDTLTSPATIVVPNNGRWFVENNAAGAFAVTFKTAGGAGTVVYAGIPGFVQADGTDALSDESSMLTAAQLAALINAGAQIDASSAAAQAASTSAAASATSAATSATDAATSATAAATSAGSVNPGAVGGLAQLDGGAFLVSGQFPALTGAITTSAGGLATSFGAGDVSALTVTRSGGLPQALSKRAGYAVHAGDYGAICDGSSHLLSGIYGSLAAAQVVYPDVTALTQEVDEAAINRALDIIRARSAPSGTGNFNIGAAGELDLPGGGCQQNATINLTGFYGSGLTFNGRGASLNCKTNGAPCIDATGLGRAQVENLSVYGNGTNSPNICLSIGRITNSGAGADGNKITNLTCSGFFTLTGLFNNQSETTIISGGDFDNWAPGAYAAIYDGANHFNVQSAFTGHTYPADTHQSFNENQCLQCTFGVRGASSIPLWIEGAHRLRLTNAYIFYSSSTASVPEPGVVLYSPSNGIQNEELDLDAHFEDFSGNNNLTNAVQFQGQAAQKQRGLKLRDNFSEQAGSVFGMGAGATSVEIDNLDMEWGTMPNSTTYWDTGSAYTVGGKIYDYSGHYSAPGTFTGMLCLNGACTNTIPTATNAVLGVVEPDGTTISNTAGAISVHYGTTSTTAARGDLALAAATAASTYAPLAGPTFTGTVTMPQGATVTGAAGTTAITTYLFYATTSSTTSTRLTTDGNAAGGSNCANLPNNTAESLYIDFTGFDVTNHTIAARDRVLDGLILKGATNGSVTMTNTITTQVPNGSIGTTTGTTFSASADTTNGCLNLSVVAPGTDTWHWVAKVVATSVQ